jgi:molecular chaperone DnaK (HSP70)
MDVVTSTMRESKLRKKDIDEVILTGGSTRIPKIQEMIKEYFNKSPLRTINPDEAVAIGAAILGSIANNVIDKGLQRLKLLDVTPLSLGIGLSNGEMDIIIRRNTQIPCERIRKYKTSKDYQSKIILKVYQGERIFTKDNSFLGNLIIRIPPLKKGEVKIDVTFEIDINGVLNIYAKDNEGKKYDLKIGVDKLLNKEEIEKNIIEKNKSDLKKVKIKKALKEICLKYKEIGSDNQKIKADEILNWIKQNKNIEIKSYEDKLKEMKDCH